MVQVEDLSDEITSQDLGNKNLSNRSINTTHWFSLVTTSLLVSLDPDLK